MSDLPFLAALRCPDCRGFLWIPGPHRHPIGGGACPGTPDAHDVTSLTGAEESYLRRAWSPVVAGAVAVRLQADAVTVAGWVLGDPELMRPLRTLGQRTRWDAYEALLGPLVATREQLDAIVALLKLRIGDAVVAWAAAWVRPAEPPAPGTPAGNGGSGKIYQPDYQAGRFLELPVDQVKADPANQPRESTDPEVVARYRLLMEEGVTFPPICVLWDGSTYWLADGFHRFAAHRALGRVTVPVRVREGTAAEAFWYGVDANSSQGMTLGTGDRKRIARRMLEEWPELGNREIARRTGLSHPTIGTLRNALLGRPDVLDMHRVRVERDGEGAGGPLLDRPDPGSSRRPERETVEIERERPPSSGQRPRDEQPPAAPPSAPQPEPVRVKLANDERAAFDAYWTPVRHAYAICLHLRNDLGIEPRSILEPAVGGGAWVVAARLVWPDAKIDRMDIDPAAPGLVLDLREGETAVVGDFMQADLGGEWDLVLGNPPYGGDLYRWILRSLEIGIGVSYLLRETFTGSQTRLRWWRNEGRPSQICKVLPRILWEGPGARDHTDHQDAVQVTWHGRVTPHATYFEWLDAEWTMLPARADELRSAS